MHFSLIQLQYFVEVANAGSFTVAARQIRVVQLTLSLSIKQLEQSLGYDVFERVPRRGVRLTRRGRRFYDEATVFKAGYAFEQLSPFTGLASLATQFDSNTIGALG